MARKTEAIVVCATRQGFIYGALRAPGDVLELERESQISLNWMKPANKRTEKLFKELEARREADALQTEQRDGESD